MSLRYALVEDEPPARLRLKRMVAELAPDSICVAEAEDGEGGLALLRNTTPDLLFLDIEFPPEGAFGLLRRAREAGLAPRASISGRCALTTSQKRRSSSAPPRNTTSPEPGALGMYIRSLPACPSPFRSLM